MTHEQCKRGHFFTDENILFVSRGVGLPKTKRQCRTCYRIRAKARYEVSRKERAERRDARIAAWKRDVDASALAWAAGHFEGEGTISIGSECRQGYARPLASLCSTDRQVIELFSMWWPASSVGKKPRYPTKNARAVYRWEINSAIKIRAFIDQISPHLRTERCRAKFALVSEFVDLMLAPHTGKAKVRHPQFVLAIRKLNQRGRVSDPSGQTVLQCVTAQQLLPAPEKQS